MPNPMPRPSPIKGLELNPLVGRLKGVPINFYRRVPVRVVQGVLYQNGTAVGLDYVLSLQPRTKIRRAGNKYHLAAGDQFSAAPGQPLFHR